MCVGVRERGKEKEGEIENKTFAPSGRCTSERDRERRAVVRRCVCGCAREREREREGDRELNLRAVRQVYVEEG